MRTEHRVFTEKDGKSIVTLIDGERSVTRFVTTVDWHNVIVPVWIRNGVSKSHFDNEMKAEIWVEVEV